MTLQQVIADLNNKGISVSFKADTNKEQTRIVVSTYWFPFKGIDFMISTEMLLHTDCAYLALQIHDTAQKLLTPQSP